MSGYELEADLVHDCQEAAKAMGAYLEVVGQRRAKGSGSTVGFPDAVLYCNGHAELIEFKRPKLGSISRGQQLAMQLRAEQGVTTHVVTSVEQFAAIVNRCRRTGRTQADSRQTPSLGSDAAATS